MADDRTVRTSSAVRRSIGRAVGVLALLAASACSSDAGSESSTPGVTLDPASTAKLPLLLTEGDVHSVRGLGSVTASVIADVSSFDNPDPRGPCGRSVPELSTVGAVGRSFSSPSVRMFELVVTADAGQQQYLVDLQADSTPGCGPFQTTTDQGKTQTVADTTFVGLGDGADASLAWTSSIDVAGDSAYVGVLLVQANGQQAFVQLVTGSPVSSSTVQAIATKVLARLTG